MSTLQKFSQMTSPCRGWSCRTSPCRAITNSRTLALKKKKTKTKERCPHVFCAATLAVATTRLILSAMGLVPRVALVDYSGGVAYRVHRSGQEDLFFFTRSFLYMRLTSWGKMERWRSILATSQKPRPHSQCGRADLPPYPCSGSCGIGVFQPQPYDSTDGV